MACFTLYGMADYSGGPLISCIPIFQADSERSSQEPLISLDLIGTKFYCFRARVHCYYCLHIIFLANPARCSEQLCAAQQINAVVNCME